MHVTDLVTWHNIVDEQHADLDKCCLTYSKEARVLRPFENMQKVVTLGAR